MPDYYDLAIEHFTVHPELIPEAWMNPACSRYGQLFSFLSADRQRPGWEPHTIGCPSLVRGGFPVSILTPDHVLQELRNDARLPRIDKVLLNKINHDPRLNPIHTEHLPAFAEWQRRFDRLLSRSEPVEVEA